jgi:hypothetical protein
MHKGQILIGALGLALAPAFAAAGLNDSAGQSTTITVQAGQGSEITMQVPAAPAPYALTGTAVTPTHEERMDFGQGASVLVRLPD